MRALARLCGRMIGVVLVGAALLSCRNASPPGAAGAEPPATVTSFLTEANAKLLRLGLEASQAGWVQETFITVDTEAISARANEAYTNAATAYAKQAARFGLTEGSPEERRQIVVLKNTITVASYQFPVSRKSCV